MSGVFIKDAVHGYIKLDNEMKKLLINNPFTERLRYIHQMGGGYLIYVSAHHTRYEHSLGVYNIATKAFDNIAKDLNYDNETKDYIRKLIGTAALFHDIGHTYFSHITENIIYQYGENWAIINEAVNRITRKGKPHERIACFLLYDNNYLQNNGLIRNKIQEIFNGNNIDKTIRDICKIIVGDDNLETIDKENRWIVGLINGVIDADRLDYMLRDSFMAGFPRTFDLERIVRSYSVYHFGGRNRIVFKHHILSSLKHLFDVRDDLYLWVYRHHKVVYVDELIRRLVFKLIQHKNNECSKLLDIKNMLDNYYADHDLLHIFKKCLRDDPLYNIFLNRSYHKSLWKNWYQYRNLVLINDIERQTINLFINKIKREIQDNVLNAINKIELIESEIIQDLHLPSHSVFLALAKFRPTLLDEVVQQETYLLFPGNVLLRLGELNIFHAPMKSHLVLYLYAIPGINRDRLVKKFIEVLEHYIE